MPLSAINQKNSATKISIRIFLLVLDNGLSSSTLSTTSAYFSPLAISSLTSSATLFSLTVKNKTTAEASINTEAIKNGNSIAQILLNAQV